MEFVKTTSATKGVKALTARLSEDLKKGKRVLWLVGGGSNIPITVEVMAGLPHEHTKNLSVFLIDERYGEINHVNSNAKQLLDNGFQPKDAIFVQVLAPGFSLEETRERYSEASKRAFENADVIVTQIGMGPDGHIAGILPNTPAATSTEWVIAYETPTYTRISLGFEALKQITAAYIFCFGTERKPALLRLRDEDLSLEEQPAQLLKLLPEAYIFNDQIGDRT